MSPIASPMDVDRSREPEREHHPDRVTSSSDTVMSSLRRENGRTSFHPVGMTGRPIVGETLPQEVSRISDPQVERIDALFVQSATAFSSGPGTITLHRLADSTVYFADRPRREIGHIPSRRFIELWEAGANTFAVDPPNAVLSFLDEDGTAPEDAVVVLREPRLEDDKLSYGVEILEGSLPPRWGPCSLFIDVFGRPLSPVSGSGAQHRRPAKDG
jgi:hypothetical protein